MSLILIPVAFVEGGIKGKERESVSCYFLHFQPDNNLSNIKSLTSKSGKEK
jgi:hypothetical protein